MSWNVSQTRDVDPHPAYSTEGRRYRCYRGLLSPGAVIAQTDLPLEIEQNAEEEYVTIRNVGDEEVDITGYYINFEAGEDSQVDQIRQLDGEVIIGPGEEVTVATGEETTIDADVELTDPYDGFVLNDEDPDVVALLDENQNIVVTSEGEAQDEGDEEDTDDGDEDDVDPGEDDEEDPGAGEDPGDDDDEDPGDRGDEEDMDEDEDEDAAAADDEKDKEEKDEKEEDETDEKEDKKDDDCP